MDLGLAGRTAVVTGASKGIGLAVAHTLASNGVKVVAGARQSSPHLDELAANGQVQIAAVDLADPGGPARLVALAGDQIDILVNNVGTAATRTGGFLSVSDDEWHATMEINLMAAVRASRSALPTMLAAGKGVIISTASVNSHLPDPRVIDYSVSKAALLSFSKALAKEVGPHGIRVNTVSPGPVSTDMWLGRDGVAATVSAATGADPKQVEKQAASEMLTGRFTTPEEVASLVAYLASDRAANITGSDFAIDGGLIPTT